MSQKSFNEKIEEIKEVEVENNFEGVSLSAEDNDVPIPPSELADYVLEANQAFAKVLKDRKRQKRLDSQQARRK
ncbi:MAG: hypothetical protein P1V20_29275 [Verrucomicrobiales bacterium]|nr:hypothetical protein [Verrucomicrobiales bacterium]